ncbi:MAG: 4-hydroxy-tetrahydrodipicolinate synthase [Butyrivibrio sp.]|nr:4-hydroxy-tetrahydrodipicolinate synthase [Butyrivibrio sp.]
MSIFKGSGVALSTPMKENGDIDFDSMARILDFQLENSTDAIIVCGTSGEAPTLDDDEHLEAVRFAIEHVNHRIPVVAGTGSNNTAHAIMMSEEVEKMGADGVLLVAPYYNKAMQHGLIKHFTAIADAIKIPCILYNVPSRTGTNIAPETAATLGKTVKNIVAIKEASGNISQVAQVAKLAEGSLDIYSGNDDQIVPVCSLGGVGVISVLANVAPQETHDMVYACLENRYDEARELQLRALPLVDALFCEVNPIPVKAALNMMGYSAGIPRLPLTEMLPENQARLREELIKFGCPVK